jgi:hypothetical protein
MMLRAKQADGGCQLLNTGSLSLCVTTTKKIEFQMLLHFILSAKNSGKFINGMRKYFHCSANICMPIRMRKLKGRSLI